MRLPRMTTRRWMVVVAIFGLAIGLSRWLWLRSVAFRRLADLHNSQAMGGIPGKAKDFPKQLFHRKMGEKYSRAVRYPWLPVEPDPTEPE
jgi:hypothetical protein